MPRLRLTFCVLCRLFPPETNLLPVHGWAGALGSASRKAALPRPPARIHRCAAGAAGTPACRAATAPQARTAAPSTLGLAAGGELQIAQPFRPRRPIVPDLTHLGGYRRRPGWGARGKLPTAQKAGSVTAGPAKANPATSSPALRSGSRQGRFTLLARERRPRRLLRPLRRKELITNGCLGVVAESGGRKRNPLRDPQQVKTQHPPA